MDGITEKITASGTNLAKAHWEYIRGLLEAHGTSKEEIEVVEFHYKTAFIHGYKHGINDVIAKEICDEINRPD